MSMWVIESRQNQDGKTGPWFLHRSSLGFGYVCDSEERGRATILEMSLWFVDIEFRIMEYRNAEEWEAYQQEVLDSANIYSRRKLSGMVCVQCGEPLDDSELALGEGRCTACEKTSGDRETT